MPPLLDGGCEVRLKVKQIRPGAKLPGRATPGSAGYDLCACCGQDGIVVKPMERVLVPTGISIELPDPGYVAMLCARSGLAYKLGLTLANGVGVIDSDYRGEIGVPVVNLSDAAVHISNGERIAQLLILPVELPEMVEIEELSTTSRGEGGFGSTGRS